MKTIALVGHDVAPSSCFALLAKELISRGQRVSSLCSSGDPLTVNKEDLKGADILVSGISSSLEWASGEVTACAQALADSIPFGFYCDSFGVHQRPWMKDFRSSAKFVFTLNEQEALAARTLFPRAEVVATGNPLHETFFDWPWTRDQVRARLAELGIKQLEKGNYIVLVPGVKHYSLNRDLLLVVCRALNQAGVRGRVFFSLHPGDKKNSPEMYQQLAGQIEGETKIPITVTTKAQITSAALLTIADLVAESTSSIGLEAACKRIPVVSYLSREAVNLLETESGKRSWTPCELDISRLVRSAEELAIVLRSFDFDWQKQRQKEVFPAPAAKGTAVRKMADVLLNLC